MAKPTSRPTDPTPGAKYDEHGTFPLGAGQNAPQNQSSHEQYGVGQNAEQAPHRLDKIGTNQPIPPVQKNEEPKNKK